MADVMSRIGEIAEEVGNMAAQLQAKLAAFGLGEGQSTMGMEEASTKLQSGQVSIELFVQLADYWKLYDKVGSRRELLEALKVEAQSMLKQREETGGKGWGGGKGDGQATANGAPKNL